MGKTIGICSQCREEFSSVKEAKAHFYKSHSEKVKAVMRMSAEDRQNFRPVMVCQVFGKKSRYTKKVKNDGKKNRVGKQS